jgi:hypothetical protein
MAVLTVVNRIALLSQEWDIRHTDARLQEVFFKSLKVAPYTLKRWLTGTTNVAKHLADDRVIETFIGFLTANGPDGDSPTYLEVNYETRHSLREALRSPEDKAFMRFMAGRAIPPSVRSLSQSKALEARRTLLTDGQPTRYFMYRLGDFEPGDEDQFNRAGPRAGRSLKVLRRVPILIEDVPREQFLLYREAYRAYTAVGSIFLVDDHFTAWGQDNNPAKELTAELFLIKWKRLPIARGLFSGLYQATVSMLGDTDAITNCKALLRRAPDALQRNEKWSQFVKKYQKTIILSDKDYDSLYEVDTDWSMEVSEEEDISTIEFAKYANAVSIRKDKADIVIVANSTWDPSA